MTTVLNAPITEDEKEFIRGKLRDAFNPRSYEVSPDPSFAPLIAGDITGNPFRDFQRRVGRATCDRWARGDRPGIVPYRDAYYRDLCAPYLADGLPGNPTTAPPFTGGQCVGDLYSISGTFTTGSGVFCSDGSPVDDFTGDITGFVGGLFTGPITSVQHIGSGTGCRGDFSGSFIRVVSAGGTITQDFSVNSASTTRTFTGFTVSASFSKVGGGVDCGDPFSEFDPGEPNPTPDPNPGPVGGPTGYPFPNLDIDINPDGTISIDFGDGSPPEDFDPTSGDGDGAPAGPAPGDQGNPGGSGDTGEAGEEEGEAPPGEVLVGLKLDLLNEPPDRYRLAPGVYRGGAYVYMGGDVGLDQDFAGSILGDGQFVHAEKENLTKWRVKSNVGFNWRVTPYYREAT